MLIGKASRGIVRISVRDDHCGSHMAGHEGRQRGVDVFRREGYRDTHWP